MSDMLNDMARDERRTAQVMRTLYGITDCLRGELSVEETVEMANNASGGRYGFFTGPVDLSANIRAILEKAKQQDTEAWVKLFHTFCRFGVSVKDIYAFSPWVGRYIIYIHYGRGFIVDLIAYPKLPIYSSSIAQLIREKGWFTYDCDRYLLVLGEPQDEVYWIECGVDFGCSDGCARPLIKPREVGKWTGCGTPQERDEYCGVTPSP